MRDKTRTRAESTRCLGFDQKVGVCRCFGTSKPSFIWSVSNKNVFPCIPVSELKKLVEWGEQERMNNNIFGKSNCDLNDDWIEKIEELIKLGLNQAEKEKV